jgi:hypothetical protein
MRVILLKAVSYPARFTGELWQGWLDFVTRPTNGTMLGPIRLLLGLLMCWNWLNLGLDLSDWLGADGWLPLASAVELRESTIPWSWSFWDFTPLWAITPLYLLSFAVLISWTMGVQCRISGPLVWLIHYSTMRRLPVMLFGFDSIIGTYILYLAVTGSGGESVSVDRWLQSRRQSAAPQPSTVRIGSVIALRLIQLQLCLIYGAAGLSKLQGEPWWNGTAAYFLVANSEFRGLSLLETMGENASFMAICTFIPLWTEILYPVLIWSKTWRPLLIILAIGMHLAIALTLGLWEFSLAMIAANMAFISPDWLRPEESN